jgi:hypothetical protein
VPLGWRMGLSVAVMSYDSALYFGVSIDGRAPEGIEAVAAYLGDAYDELWRAVEIVPAHLRGEAGAPSRGETDEPSLHRDEPVAVPA